jgi:hypothetical protein
MGTGPDPPSINVCGSKKVWAFFRTLETFLKFIQSKSVLRIRYVYHGFRIVIFISRIPDPTTAPKEEEEKKNCCPTIFTQKFVMKLSKILV